MKRTKTSLLSLLMVLCLVFSLCPTAALAAELDTQPGTSDVGGTDTGADTNTNTGGDDNTSTGDNNNSNTGDNSSSSTGDDNNSNTGDNSSSNTGDDNNSNTGDDNSSNTGDDNSSNTGGDNSSNTGDNNSSNTGDNNSSNTGDNNSSNTGDNNSSNTGDDNNSNTGDNNNSSTGDDADSNTGDDADSNTGDDDNSNTGDDIGEEEDVDSNDDGEDEEVPPLSDEDIALLNDLLAQVEAADFTPMVMSYRSAGDPQTMANVLKQNLIQQINELLNKGGTKDDVDALVAEVLAALEKADAATDNKKVTTKLIVDKMSSKLKNLKRDKTKFTDKFLSLVISKFEAAVDSMDSEQQTALYNNIIAQNNVKNNKAQAAKLINILNETVALSAEYYYTASFEPGFDLSQAGAWIEGIDGNYYTYCSEEKLSYPKDGILFAKRSDSTFDETTSRQLARILNAGFPLDLYGFSKSAYENDKISNRNMGFYTQALIWEIIDGKTPDYFSYTYDRTLYDYAVGTDTLTPVNAAQVDWKSEDQRGDSLEMKRTDETYQTNLTLQANKAVQVQVTAIPENCTLTTVLFGKEKEISVNDTIDPSMPLTLSCTKDNTPIGNLSFSYVSYQTVAEDSFQEFVSYQLVYLEGYGELSNPYQRMIGFGLNDQTETLSISVALEDGTNPEPDPNPNPNPTPTPDPDPVPPSKPDRDHSRPTPTPTPDVPEVEIPDPDVPQGDLPDIEVDLPDAEIPQTDLPDVVPEIEIPEEVVPLAPAPAETPAPSAAGTELIILDSATPLGNLPQTGTQAPQRADPTAALLGAGGLLLALLALIKRKQDN